MMEVGRRAESGAGILSYTTKKADSLLAAVSKATEQMTRALPRKVNKIFINITDCFNYTISRVS